jgi:hypothetical protein
VAGKRYPWEAAGSLRQGHRLKAERALSLAQAELEQARVELSLAQQTLQARLDDAKDVKAGSAVASDESSMLELQRVAAYAQRQAETTRRARARLTRAQACAAEREAALQRAQLALGEARAGERVIERDRERFQREQRREIEHAEELELEAGRTRGRDEPQR